MDAQDRLAAAHVGAIDDDLAVEAARAQQRRIEHVGAVRRGDQDDAGVLIEAVHLDQQLIERLLALVVSAAETRAALAADRVDLVDEDDARRALLRLLEEVAHARRADADEHLDEVRARDREERHARLAGDGARASSVLPEPGGPSSSTPLGMRAPSAWNFFGYLRNSTTSPSSSFASSTPATSAKVTLGRFSLSSLARERPNDSAWLPPLCAWRKMKISSSAINRNGTNWKIGERRT